MTDLTKLRLEVLQKFVSGKPVDKQDLTRCHQLSEQTVRQAYTVKGKFPVGMLVKHRALTLVHGCPDLLDPPVRAYTPEEMIRIQPEVLALCTLVELRGLCLYTGLMHEFLVSCTPLARFAAHAGVVAMLLELGEELKAVGLMWENSLEGLSNDHLGVA